MVHGEVVDFKELFLFYDQCHHVRVVGVVDNHLQNNLYMHLRMLALERREWVASLSQLQTHTPYMLCVLS